MNAKSLPSRMSNQKYSARRKYYADKGHVEIWAWTEYEYNALARAIENGDGSHLEDLFNSARGVHRIQRVRHVVRELENQVARFPWPIKNEKINAPGCYSTYTVVYDRDENGDKLKLTDKQKANMRLLRNGWEAVYIAFLDHEEAYQDSDGKKTRGQMNWPEVPAQVVSFAERRLKRARDEQAPADVIHKLELLVSACENIA